MVYLSLSSTLTSKTSTIFEEDVGRKYTHVWTTSITFLEMTCLVSPIINYIFVGKKNKARKKTRGSKWARPKNHWLLDPNPRGWGVLFAPFLFRSTLQSRHDISNKLGSADSMTSLNTKYLSIVGGFNPVEKHYLVKLSRIISPSRGEKNIWNPCPEIPGWIGIIISTQLELYYEIKRVIPKTRLYLLGEQLHGALSWWNSPKEVDVTICHSLSSMPYESNPDILGV